MALRAVFARLLSRQPSRSFIQARRLLRREEHPPRNDESLNKFASIAWQPPELFLLIQRSGCRREDEIRTEVEMGQKIVTTFTIMIFVILFALALWALTVSLTLLS